MNRALPLLLIAACGCFADNGGTAKSRSGTFSILTYNVAGLPDGISSADPESDTSRISPLLNGYDLIGVQEDFYYHADLIKSLTHPYQTTPNTMQSSLGDGLNLFSRFPLGDVERIAWNECDGADCLTPKGMMHSTIEVTPGVVIDIFNHHHEANSNQPSLAARAANVQQMVDYLLETSVDNPLIVVGDTNLHWTDEPDIPLLERYHDDLNLVDACLALTCGEDHIDRIYVRSGNGVILEAITWEVASEFGTTDTDKLSDHLAIAVTVNWYLE